MISTPPIPPKIYVRNRHKRCYELVANALLREPDDTKWCAIHGTYHGTIEHAWLEHQNGWAFDCVKLELLPAAEYLVKYDATRIRAFERMELARYMALSGLYEFLGRHPPIDVLEARAGINRSSAATGMSA